MATSTDLSQRVAGGRVDEAPLLQVSEMEHEHQALVRRVAGREFAERLSSSACFLVVDGTSRCVTCAA